MVSLTIVWALLLVSIGNTIPDTSCGPDSEDTFDISCNKDIDPWKETRKTMELLVAGSKRACGEKLPDDTLAGDTNAGGCQDVDEAAVPRLWTYVEDGGAAIENVVEGEDVEERDFFGDVGDNLETVTDATGSVTDFADVALEILESAEIMKKGLKVLGALASTLQFVGPILDIVMMFMPEQKSAELMAIESGFAKMGARMDAMSAKLDSISGAVEWNALLTDFLKFESKVDELTQDYQTLRTTLKSRNPRSDMSPKMKSMIENLIESVGGQGDIGGRLNHIVRLFKGESELNEGKSLLEIYMTAMNNDCSKVLPFSNALIKVVMSAQKLVFIHDVSKELISPDDDMGHPRMLYDMYKISTDHYIKCLKTAPAYANEEVKLRFNDGEELRDIIPDLESKNAIYNWATIKESDVTKRQIQLLDNAASTREVELTGLSEDDQEKERLTLLSVTKPSVKQVKTVSDKIYKVLKKNLYKSPVSSDEYIKLDSKLVPVTNVYGPNPVSTGPNPDGPLGRRASKEETLIRTKNLLKSNDEYLKYIFEKGGVTVAMFEKGQAELIGWHYTLDIPVEFFKYESFTRKHKTFTMGFLFSFGSTTSSDFKCENANGVKYFMSSDTSLPYCLCNMGFGGDHCDIPLQKAQTDGSDVVSVVQSYRVPGMFDVEAQIDENTDKVLDAMNKNKEEIFKEAQNTRLSITESKNTILTAQSVMLNKMQADNNKLLSEFAGLRKGIETMLKKERNERAYQTEKGQRVVLGTIKSGLKKVHNHLKNLKGTVVQNRYFHPLRFTIPVYQDEFSIASEYDNDYAMEDFSTFLHDNNKDFNEAKQAVEMAITAEKDSFISAVMDESMVSGCNDDYSQHITSTWQELFQMHLSLTTMETKVYNFLIARTEASSEGNTEVQNTCSSIFTSDRGYLEFKMKKFKEDVAKMTSAFKNVYNTRSCPEFIRLDIEGGGCKAATTHPGQVIPISCADQGKSLILSPEGDLVTDITCGYESEWTVEIPSLMCVSNCEFDGETSKIGETRLLPEPAKGYQWKDGATETKCVASLNNADDIKGVWDVTEQEDVDECAEEGFCGPGATGCANSPGGFTCSCENGYHINEVNGKCSDKDECHHGEVGYTMCLVQQNLGTCSNSKGGYSCACLVGSYANNENPGKECVACDCVVAGTEKEVCDSSGECQCKDRVAGTRCETCAEGYGNYPFCNQCATGYYNYPTCTKCSCSEDGVSSDVCDSVTGECMCKSEGVTGVQCDSCLPGYEDNYPDCDKIVSDGTLSEWGDWHAWADIANCGSPNTVMIAQRRTRERTCDDSTLNSFGKSCSRAITQDVQTRDVEACAQIDKLILTTNGGWLSGTDGKVWMKVKQPGTEIFCESNKATFQKPDGGKIYRRKAVDYGCNMTIDLRKPIQMMLLNDNGNDLHVKQIALTLNNEVEYFHKEDWKLDKDNPLGWCSLEKKED